MNNVNRRKSKILATLQRRASLRKADTRQFQDDMQAIEEDSSDSNSAEDDLERSPSGEDVANEHKSQPSLTRKKESLGSEARMGEQNLPISEAELELMAREGRTVDVSSLFKKKTITGRSR